MATKDRYKIFTLAALVFCASLAFRLAYLDSRAIWFDEASSWVTANLDYFELQASLEQSTHVPLYYPVLHCWMVMFGESPIAIRSLSVTLGMLTVAGVGYLGLLTISAGAEPQNSKAVTRWYFALLAAALCGTSAFQVHASVEARMYTAGTFLCVLSTASVLHLLQDTSRRRCWVALFWTTVASLYTHHLLAVTAMVQAAWLAWNIYQQNAGLDYSAKTRLAWRYWRRSVGAAIVCWIPVLILWWKQFHAIQQGFWIPPLDGWSIPRTFMEFVASPPPGLSWNFREWGITPAMLCVVMFVGLWRTKNAAVRLLVLQSVVPLLLIGIVSLKTPLWEARYFRFAHVTMILCVAISIWQLFGSGVARRAVVISGLALSCCGTVLFWHWRDIPHRQANRGAAMAIDADHQHANSRVVVTSPIDFVVMKYYAKHWGWPEDRVKLWTGPERIPGASVHLIKNYDWWNPTATNLNEPVWLVEPLQPETRSTPSTRRTSTASFHSDLWLNAWSVRLNLVPAKELR